MPGLTRLFANLWERVKWGSSVPTLQITEDDIVIFVVGPTGSGKSWFIREATNSDVVKASRDYHPFTGEVQAIKCELTSEAKRELQGPEGIGGVIFVDTPSFLTACEHLDVSEAFNKWFNEVVYKPRFDYVGIIYMHRVETDPALEPIQNHLREFFSIIHRVAIPKHLHVVVSYDDTSSTIPPPKIKERISKLETQLKESRAPPNASIHTELFKGSPEVAWRAVGELFRG